MAESADFLINRRPRRAFLLSISCIFVADGAKIEQKAEDLLEEEPLVCRVRVMWCKVVFCALFIVQPES